MKKNRGIAVLVLTVIITAFLCYTAGFGFGPTGTGSAKNIKTGLDLAGGVSITYQAKEENPDSEDRKYFVPLGYSEMVTMICDGILRERGSSLEEYFD